MSKAKTMASATVQETAEYYIGELGWGLCRFASSTKGPNLPGWNQPRLVIDSLEKASQITEDSNIGLVHQASNTCALDIDNLEYARLMFGEFGIDLDTVLGAGLQITSGRPNRAKAIFRIPAYLLGATMFKINWPDRDNPNELICVAEFRVGAVQDVLPPSIHPDTGRPYQWINAPWDNNNEVPELPFEIAQIIKFKDDFKGQLRDACPWIRKEPHSIKPGRAIGDKQTNNIITQFNDAHDVGEMLQANGYKKKGNRFLAPNSSTRIPGVILFDDGAHFFSHHGSCPFGDGKRHDAFDLFQQFECAGNFQLALDQAKEILGLNEPAMSDEQIKAMIESARSRSKPMASEKAHPEPKSITVPRELETIPGVLGQAVAWINHTSRKPQPMFAVQAALAFGSVVLGRRYKTDHDNWPSLYFLNLGKSGSGKEHAKHCIEKMLHSAELGDLVGFSRYSSEPGILSGLLAKPTHISILDEFGKMLESAAGQGNYLARDVLKALLEIWGRCGGIMQPGSYSTAGLSDEQAQAMMERKIENPALTLLGMTTPEPFYEAVGSKSVRDGFLNRFLVFHSPIGRQKSRLIPNPPAPPDSVIEWAKQMRDLGALGNMADLTESARTPAKVQIIPFSEDCYGLLNHMEDVCIERQERLELIGLSEMWGRTAEIAMKLSLIVARSCGSDVVETNHLEWAWKYAAFLQDAMVDDLKDRISDSPFAAAKLEIMRHLKAAGSDGLTHREMAKKCHKYAAANPKLQDELLASLVRDEDAQLVKQAGQSGRGRKRISYVATEFVQLTPNNAE